MVFSRSGLKYYKYTNTVDKQANCKLCSRTNEIVVLLFHMARGIHDFNCIIGNGIEFVAKS